MRVVPMCAQRTIETRALVRLREHLYKEGETAGFIMSVIGAVLLLVIYGMVVKKPSGGDGASS